MVIIYVFFIICEKSLNQHINDRWSLDYNWVFRVLLYEEMFKKKSLLLRDIDREKNLDHVLFATLLWF